MEDYFRVLIEKCKEGKLSANDILDKVAKTNFQGSTPADEPVMRIPKPKTLRPEFNEKLTERPPKTSLGTSTRPTEFVDTQESELNNPSIAEGIEDPDEIIDESEESDEDLIEEKETWNVMFEKQMKKRMDFLKQYQDRDLQQYIEDQLTTIFDNIRTVHTKEQLEDIKRKCRFKWFLRMKKLRDGKKAKDEEDFRANCSFQPKINDSNVQPRYLEIQTKPSLTYISRECTFSPDLSKASKSTRSYGNFGNSVKDSLRSLGNSTSMNKNSSVLKPSLTNVGKLMQPRTISDIEPQSSKNGRVVLDDDMNALNDFMGSLCSVENYPKDTSSRMHIRDLQPSQEEEIRIEKTLIFTDCKEKLGDSRRQSMNTKNQVFLEKHGLRSSNTTRSSKQHDKGFSFERLAQPRARSIKALPKDQGFVSGDWNKSTRTPKAFNKAITRPSAPIGKTPARPVSSSKKILEESINRQDRFDERKVEKMSQLSSAIKEKHPFRPEISITSEFIDRKALEDYSHRDRRLDERKEKKIQQLDKENQEKHPFKPTISKASQILDRKTYDDKVTNFIKNREERLEMLRQQKALKELEGVTHQPTINKAVPATSKLGLNLSTKEYIGYLKDKEEVDRQFIEIAKRRKEAIEAIECTHTPQISVKPMYSRTEFSSPKVSMQSPSSHTNYKGLHQKKKEVEAAINTSKLPTWNIYQREPTYVPSLFDECLHNELSFDQHGDSCRYSFQ